MVGIAGASILSMSYFMLAGHLPFNKIGIYMGIFNFFIVLPEIIGCSDRRRFVDIGGIIMCCYR
jgi:hypothetical protein